MNKFYIRPEGISKPCPLYAAVYTEQDLELAENKEFILKGIHVIEYDASREREYKAMKTVLEYMTDEANGKREMHDMAKSILKTLKSEV